MSSPNRRNLNPEKIGKINALLGKQKSTEEAAGCQSFFSSGSTWECSLRGIGKSIRPYPVYKFIRIEKFDFF